MSIAVELADLPDAIARRGPGAFLVTIGEGGPHVVSVSVAMVGGHLDMGAGRRTARNVAARPAVTLLWPHGVDHPDDSLLVDGTASLADDDDRLTVTPSSAILHRSGGVGGTC